MVYRIGFAPRGGIGAAASRTCVCRVAQPGSPSRFPEESKNGAPATAAVSPEPQADATTPATLGASFTDPAPPKDSSGNSINNNDVDTLASQRDQLKLRILNSVAGTDRGASATLLRHRQVARLTQELAELNPTTDAFSGHGSKINGSWELVYTTAETFRSSPFFWAFGEGLIRDRDMSSAIFAFTDNIPGAYIGQAVQDIDMQAGSLVSKVKMTVFPALSGTVVTTSSITGYGTDCEVTVLNTRVDDSVFSPFLDNITVPVQQIFERLRGTGATTVDASVLYLDDDFRIVRTVDDQVFMYTRMI